MGTGGWYCRCKTGSRTVGCCSHIASVIYYLGYARYLDTPEPARALYEIFPESEVVDGIEEEQDFIEVNEHGEEIIEEEDEPIDLNTVNLSGLDNLDDVADIVFEEDEIDLNDEEIAIEEEI